MLRSGMALRDVARKLTIVDNPVTTQQVIKWRDEVLEEINETMRLDAQQYRAIELERLDRAGNILDAAMTQIVSDFGLTDGRSALDGEEVEPLALMLAKVKAAQVLATVVDKLIKVSSERAKLLGINAPTKVDLSTALNDGDDLANVDFRSMTDEQLSLFYAEKFN